MRFTLHPRGFKTKHWRTLYEAHIPDLETLKKSASNAAFIVMDAEPWGVDNSKPAEIGISLLPPLDFDSATIGALPKTLDAVSRCYGLETHWIRVVERERRDRNREMHRFGEQHHVEGDQVEQTLSGIIDSFQERHGKQCSLILAGFDLVFEFRILSSLYPGLLNYFTSWLDLQELASDAAGGLVRPGLRETQIACGFENNPGDLQGLGSQRNAATDSVRAATLLVQFLGLPTSGEKLEIGRPSHKSSKKRRNAPATPEEKIFWYGARPRPKEFFPYTARVSRTTGFGDFQMQNLFDLFADYKPTAVGINNARQYGWVCLPDKETLEDFVRRVNGTEASDGDTWAALSDYDPAVVPARDWEELKSKQGAELQAKADEKRAQRRLRREAQSGILCELSNYENIAH